MTDRLARLRQGMEAHGLDAVLISSPDNRRHLSGFAGSAGYLLISATDAVLATDFRYVEQAGRQAPAFRVERTGQDRGWFAALAEALQVRRLGFEDEDMTVATHAAFLKTAEEAQGGFRPALVPASEWIEPLRARKDAEEVRLITRAIEIADQAMDEVAPGIEPGQTEEQVAWKLEKRMRALGAEGNAFDIIVGSGPNGALPHHRAGTKAIQRGEAVVIDMGATFQGYRSDLTRTVFVGEPDETFSRVYATVLRAQLAAEEGIRGGMTGAEADAIARDVITQAGYGDNFGHSLGHGLGLAVHEHPGVGPRSKATLEDGMVFTVEPGIYVSGWGGVRIEDVVVLENGRARVITRARKLEL